jgi:transposase InsO family protein
MPMPWSEVKPMDQKLLFIADYLRKTASFTDLCHHYGISRKTGYKWVQRYQQLGIEALNDQSRRPIHSPTQVPYKIQQSVIELRQQRKILLGAKKIQALLKQRYPHEVIPSKTTIYNILKRENLIKPRSKTRKISPYPQPFAPVNQVNECWSADFKGQFKMRNGQWCYPLTIMDHKSRYLLCCEGMHNTTTTETQKAFVRLFKEHGLPQRIRTDNGVPFSTRATGGLSKLAVWWIRLGILPERIEPGKPQQNGQHERMHRTLKQAVTKPPATSMKGQQKLFKLFCDEYNYQRPHESLNQETPASHYTPSSREYPTQLPEMIYPDYYDVRRVGASGVTNWRNQRLYISHLLEGEYVGLDEVDDGIWKVYFGPIVLGEFDERNVKGHSVPYLTIKV